MDVSTHAVQADYFPKEDGPAVAKLRHEMAELVAGMICMMPMAPTWLRAFWSSRDS